MKTTLLKSFAKLFCILIVHFIALFFIVHDSFAQTITRDDNNNGGTDFVCPVLPIGYTLNVANTNYTNCQIKWTATGGDIVGADNLRQVSVKWNDTPNTMAQLKCTLSGCTDSDGNSITGKDVTFTNQLILSVKNQPFSGSYTNAVNINYCTTTSVTLTVPTMAVQGTGGIA